VGGSKEEKYPQKAVPKDEQSGSNWSRDASALKSSSPQNKPTVLLLSKITLQKPGYMTLNDEQI
jgi:hypothetical protein